MESRKSYLNKIKLIINSVQLKCGSYTMRKIVRLNAVYACTGECKTMPHGITGTRCTM